MFSNHVSKKDYPAKIGGCGDHVCLSLDLKQREALWLKLVPTEVFRGFFGTAFLFSKAIKM